MTQILKLNRHNAKREIEFELRFLKSLSIRKRFEMMFEKTNQLVNLLEKSGHRRSFEVIKRT
jgi:hypothetical protein